MNYQEYEKKVKAIYDINDECLDVFSDWLVKKQLTSKTINNHINNVSFYINDFLNYYEPKSMEDGCYMLDEYLGDWFIRKCMWSNASSIKSNATSIKKFYQCMLELNRLDKEAYNYLCTNIKDNMNDWVYKVNVYNMECEEDDFEALF